MNEPLHFFNQTDLIYRLSKGLEREQRQAVFLVGAGLSLPLNSETPGVLSTEAIIQLIKQEFSEEPEELESFGVALRTNGQNGYQAAFLFVQGRLGQSAVTAIVRRAVLAARDPSTRSLEEIPNPGSLSDEELRLMDLDCRWFLNPGTEALGKLIAHYSERFGEVLLTTNFDPLLEVAIRKASGEFYKTALHADATLTQTDGKGCHVVHLHGYWYGADSLHTPSQLQQSRPHLKASLASLLRNKLVVVCGYGGWDDVFTDALFDVVSDDTATPEILWAFHEKKPHITEHLQNKIAAGLIRGRVSLYSDVDCNSALPKLYEAWSRTTPSTLARATNATNPVHISPTVRAEFELRGQKQTAILGDDEDRPPVVTICVGREAELAQLRESPASVVFITGFGGQGKSTLAAQHFSEAQQNRSHDYYVWRDCKEESERFENQLASVVETLSNGRISGQDLAKQDIKSIVQLYMSLTSNKSVLLIFDNTDHYVNLEAGRMTSSAELLVREMLASNTKSRILLTCRPSINYRNAAALSCHLEGVSLEATKQLFEGRGANCAEDEIADAHTATNGHVFWLDLLAIQTKTQPTGSLRDLLERLRMGGGSLPENTLRSIWEGLHDREKLILRFMAEAVRPETESEIAEHLHGQMNYVKVVKALNVLKSLNLVVTKLRPAGTDVFELHPLVRHFIKQRFTKPERSTFIQEIIKAYQRFISRNKFRLAEHPTLSILQNWTQTAELDIAAGRTSDAISILAEAGSAFASSGYSREFTRTVRLLLSSFDWIAECGRYKDFDELFKIHMHNLCHLGEWPEAEAIMDKFQLSVVERNARYILYCDLKCYLKWTRGELSDAVKWGKIGRAIKESSNVDTAHDVAHNLALAERDAGQPELALTVFLDGRDLDEVLDPDELDEERSGPHYGNVGRCLHFMGQVEQALVCYQKSALLIEKDFEGERVLNQGYIRRWIGELLLARGETHLAGIFIEAAKRKWKQVSPPQAGQISALQHQRKGQMSDCQGLSDDELERTCIDWISGRPVEA